MQKSIFSNSFSLGFYKLKGIKITQNHKDGHLRANSVFYTSEVLASSHLGGELEDNQMVIQNVFVIAIVEPYREKT